MGSKKSKFKKGSIPEDYLPSPRLSLCNKSYTIVIEVCHKNPGNLVVQNKLNYFIEHPDVIGLWILGHNGTFKDGKIDIHNSQQWIYHIINNYSGPVLLDIGSDKNYYYINRPIKGEDGFVDEVNVTPVQISHVLVMEDNMWKLIKDEL